MNTARRAATLVATVLALTLNTVHAADQASATSAMPKFSGLLQAWYLSGDDPTVDTFRLRRSELKAVGQVERKFGGR